MEEENDLLEVSNPDEDSDLDPTENAEENAELLKAQELAENYKIRAEKAEAKAKQLKNEPKPKKEVDSTGELSQKDVFILAQAGLHPDDLDEVIKYAKYEGITAGEALKSTILKTIIAERTEERKTAETTQTRGGQRGALKQSEEAMIENARSGKETDPEKLAEARMAIKLKRVSQ